MSTTTNKYKLIKPALSDPADITATNANWDKVDELLGDALDIVPISRGGTGATEYWMALKNLGNLTSVTGSIPTSLPLVYSNAGEVGVVNASCTTEEFCKAMRNYQCVTFVHNADNAITLTDIPMNYGVCTLFRGYNNNYLVGLFFSTEGKIFRYKYHTTETETNGWVEINANSVVDAVVG